MVLSSKRRLSVCIGCDKIRGHGSGVIVLVDVVVVARVVMVFTDFVVVRVVAVLAGFVVVRVVVVLAGFVVVRVVIALVGFVAMVVSSSEVTGSMELKIKSVMIET